MSLPVESTVPITLPESTSADNKSYVHRRRNAISAEPFSSIMAADWTPPVHPKTEEQLEHLKEIVANNILFSHLDENHKNTILVAMFRVEKAAKDVIIRQGDEGDNFYIIDQGKAEVFKTTASSKEPEHVMSYGPGDSFGELALMYDSPRAATVVAVTDCKLWAMDRMTYKRILMGATIEKRQKWIHFLNNVPFLASLQHYERLRVADCLKTAVFPPGHVIIKQGDPGNEFYIIEEGEVVCTKEGVDQPLCKLKVGDYFGEIALLTNQPRAATVAAVGLVRCIVLSREAFKRVLGDLSDLLKRNMENYRNFLGSI